MAPTPKRRHSTRRTGKRRASKKTALPQVVYDEKTGKPRMAHRNLVQTLVNTTPQIPAKVEKAPKKETAEPKESPKKASKAVK